VLCTRFRVTPPFSFWGDLPVRCLGAQAAVHRDRAGQRRARRSPPALVRQAPHAHDARARPRAQAPPRSRRGRWMSMTGQSRAGEGAVEDRDRSVRAPKRRGPRR